MMLPRLIALFPGIDIGVLSSALDRADGSFEQATDFVRDSIGEISTDVKKARPVGSARRREQKLSNDGERNRRQSIEDDALYRQLAMEEDKTLAMRMQRDLTAGEDFHDTPKRYIDNSYNAAIIKGDAERSQSKSFGFPQRDDDSYNDSANLVEVMTREAIVDAAAKSKMSSYSMAKSAASLSSDVLRPSRNLNDTTSSNSRSPENNQFDSESQGDERKYDSDMQSDRVQVKKPTGGIQMRNDIAPAAEESLQKQLQEILSYTTMYQPETIELFTELKCFIPDYIPAIGDIDPMIKIPRPTQPAKGQKSLEAISDNEKLGLTILDEPATKQSDPAVLDLQLRAASKGKNINANQNVRSIQLVFSKSPEAQQGQKALAELVQNVNDLHVHKPPDRVEYSKRMPDIENLMEEWPAAINVAFSTDSIKLPNFEIDLSLMDFSKLICNILDIPVNIQSHASSGKNSMKSSHSHIESLHVLFTLFSEFQNSQHFGRAEWQ